MSSLEREIEHETGVEATSENLLANVDEKMENVLQLQKIKELTVEEGVMTLPVTTVTKAKNSSAWAIEIEHPEEGTHRLFRSNPSKGWTVNEGNIVEMMDWYGIKSEDPYHLQLHHIYVEYDPENAEQVHGWKPIKPPEDTSGLNVRQSFMRKTGAFVNFALSNRPSRTVTAMWCLLLTSTVVGTLTTAPILNGLLIEVGWSILMFAVFTIMGLLILEKEE
jgi:hypothetical protein